VEGQGVGGVADQGGNGVVVGIAQGFGDRVGQQRVRADLNERGMAGPCSRDRLGKTHRAAQVGHPIVGVKGRGLPGKHGGEHRDGWGCRRQIGQRRPQLGQDHIDGGVMGGHIHLDAAGQPILAGHHRDQRIDVPGWAGDHRLAR
jgi:hypothetical protein